MAADDEDTEQLVEELSQMLCATLHGNGFDYYNAAQSLIDNGWRNVMPDTNVKTYRRIPTTIQALQWTGQNTDELRKWCGDNIDIRGAARLWVAANTTWLPLRLGEWVARDELGFYPIQDSVFVKSYEVEM